MEEAGVVEVLTNVYTQVIHMFLTIHLPSQYEHLHTQQPSHIQQDKHTMLTHLIYLVIFSVYTQFAGGGGAAKIDVAKVIN